MASKTLRLYYLVAGLIPPARAEIRVPATLRLRLAVLRVAGYEAGILLGVDFCFGLLSSRGAAEVRGGFLSTARGQTCKPTSYPSAFYPCDPFLKLLAG